MIKEVIIEIERGGEWITLVNKPVRFHASVTLEQFTSQLTGEGLRIHHSELNHNGVARIQVRGLI